MSACLEVCPMQWVQSMPVLQRGIPPRIKEDNIIGCGEIEVRSVVFERDRNTPGSDAC
ncbi:MAG: hypothetical protein M2R45_01079 [Verrucomicrobia subdivision 3 bacterium]|nr:hypothetical protein [Limisphaerales bacterium]MCS1414189.1 hypothetical protein [Limisphaerales bacterium]